MAKNEIEAAADAVVHLLDMSAIHRGAKAEVLRVADNLGIGSAISDDYRNEHSPDLERTALIARKLGATLKIVVEHPDLETP